MSCGLRQRVFLGVPLYIWSGQQCGLAYAKRTQCLGSRVPLFGTVAGGAPRRSGGGLIFFIFDQYLMVS